MTTPKTKGPNPIDVYVGSRVRMRRLMLNLSQEKLGKALGLTFQQVQKYEKGVNLHRTALDDYRKARVVRNDAVIGEYQGQWLARSA